MLKHSFTTAVTALKTNRSRSALTILGIVIGITAIILVMFISQEAGRLILAQVEGLGSRIIIIEPGREPTGPADIVEIFTDSLKEREVDAISARVQGIEAISPNVIGTMTVTYQNETKRSQVLGSAETIENIHDLKLSEGTFFSREEVRQRASVGIIGWQLKKDLFGDGNAIGEKIKIKDRTFKIVGIMSAKGKLGVLDTDNMVVVPYTTAQKYELGINYFHSITIKALSEELVPKVVREIEYTIRELHNITDPDKDDFHVFTQEDVAERVGNITAILSALLVSVAGVSLVVGGIGIMNIMLVSVTERTREIGLRKALGATEKDILRQFLIEAVILTVVGGIVGILLGIFFAFILSLIFTSYLSIPWLFSVPFTAAFLGFGVSALVGLVFGIYPARQAARKNPIEALRYE